MLKFKRSFVIQINRAFGFKIISMSSLESNLLKVQEPQQESKTPQVQQQKKPQQENAIMVAGQPTIKQQQTSTTEISATSTTSVLKTSPEDVDLSNLTTQTVESKQQHTQLQQDQQPKQQQQQKHQFQPLKQQKPSKHQFLHTMPINTKITTNLQHAATISCNNNHNNSGSSNSNININIINGSPSSSSTIPASTQCRGVTNAQVRKFSQTIYKGNPAKTSTKPNNSSNNNKRNILYCCCF